MQEEREGNNRSSGSNQSAAAEEEEVEERFCFTLVAVITSGLFYQDKGNSGHLCGFALQPRPHRDVRGNSFKSG